MPRRLLHAVLFATVLFPLPAQAADGDWVALTDLSAFAGKHENWQRVEALTLEPANPKKLRGEGEGAVLWNGPKGSARDLVTKLKYTDAEVHVEFLIAKGSNSGVKLHGHYEVQILDSWGKKELTGDDCGGIYPRAEYKPKYHHIDKGTAPRSNACKAPGEWQTLDIVFRGPRFGADGKKTTNAKLVKVELNGTLIHENLELLYPTGHAWHNAEKATGPLLLQGDHGPVAFRNVRLRPLTEGK